VELCEIWASLVYRDTNCVCVCERERDRDRDRDRERQRDKGERDSLIDASRGLPVSRRQWLERS
jgi:hypothetical protein